MALTGNSIEEKIYNFLYGRIKNAFGVSGLMGNLFAESGLVPTNLQNPDGFGSVATNVSNCFYHILDGRLHFRSGHKDHSVLHQHPAQNLRLPLIRDGARHREHAQVHDMLVESFQQFLVRNVRAYGHPEMPVNFVGGVAHVFRDELSQAVLSEGMTLGQILQSPIEKMAEFHALSPC